MSYQEQTTVASGAGVDPKLATTSVFDRASVEPSLSEFVEAARSAGLESILKGAELITLFAPNNDALHGNLPGDRDALRDMLVKYILRGRIGAVDIKQSNSLKTLEGATVPVGSHDGTISFAGGAIITQDIACTNGVLHIINGV